MRAVDPRFAVERPGPARWFGVYPGTVADTQDPDSQGRVKVELLVTPVDGGDRFAVWARVATLMAGDDRGSFFIPDKGDEVLIAFGGGDVRFPYVVGALWNGKDKPPQSMDADNNIRVLKTRSGHKLEFDDTQGAAKITLTTPLGNEVVLDDGGGGSIKINHHAGSSIEMDATGGIKITALTQLQIQAPQVKIDAPMTNVSGVVKAPTVISDAVVGTSYTPGAGNIW